MSESPVTPCSETRSPRFLQRDRLPDLLDALKLDGYELIGPTVSQSAVVYREITGVPDLPIGLTDEQEPGRYRLVDSGRGRVFDALIGPDSWKRVLFPPELTVARLNRTAGEWTTETPQPESRPRALIGVRACDLAAIAVQDRVFLHGEYVDPEYEARRSNLFIVAVNCTRAASTCFCVSAGSGPRCGEGFDLALTELDDGFVVETGSDSGRELLSRLQTEPANCDRRVLAENERQRAVTQQHREKPPGSLRNALLQQLDHPHWETIGERCLGCTNCTMVCPTCFCSTVDDLSDLSGDLVERTRRWSSCFDIDFTTMSHGTPQNRIANRYRQWLTHKFASWEDQFGVSGCVGCGRCIAWCPVGIDVTEELSVFATSAEQTAIADEVSGESGGNR